MGSAAELPSSSIPVIDITKLNISTGKQVVEAAATYGFLFITGDDIGFDANIVENAFDLVLLFIRCLTITANAASSIHQSQRFFSCALSEKQEIAHGTSV